MFLLNFITRYNVYMCNVPDSFQGKWVSELCSSDVLIISSSSLRWKHIYDDEIDMLDVDALRKRFSGNYEIQINDFAVTIFFFNVQSDTASTMSGFYQFVLDETGRLHMHYQYEMDVPSNAPDKDSFWRECYIYNRA